MFYDYYLLAETYNENAKITLFCKYNVKAEKGVVESSLR